jgi:L-aminopeptidase/D-esterase-like protein
VAQQRDAITDVTGIRVGHWTYRRGATGCTVVLCPSGAVGGVDVRGAAPGTRETDLLRPGNLVEEVHAVLISGGSAFGLAAADGVTRYLAERGVGLSFGGRAIPIVPAAILFDLGIGTPRAPDSDAGYRAAQRATSGRVEEGTVGAGTGATVAKLAGRERALKGGLGTASEHLDVGVVVGAVAAVNAVGAIRDPRTGELVAAPRADGGGFVDLDAHLRTGRVWPELEPDEDGEPEPVEAEAPVNTTLAVVATNAKLSREQTNRLATVCQDGFARTIWPAHGRGDGDVVFTLATGEVEVDAPAYGALEAMATRAVERAVLRGVRRATGLAGVPSAAEWRALSGG